MYVLNIVFHKQYNSTQQFSKVCDNHGQQCEQDCRCSDTENMMTAQKSSGLLLYAQSVLSAYLPLTVLLNEIHAAVLRDHSIHNNK